MSAQIAASGNQTGPIHLEPEGREGVELSGWTAPGNWGGTCTFGFMENALKVRDIADWLEAWAPRHLAESYDNVGLLVGSPNDEADCEQAPPPVRALQADHLAACLHPVAAS